MKSRRSAAPLPSSAWRGNEFRARRRRLGITQKALSEKTLISVKRISEYERGVHTPRPENQALLFQALQGAEEARAGPSRLPVVGGLTLVVGGEYRSIVAWEDDDGLPGLIAERRDEKIISISTRAVSPDDMPPVRAALERLLERMRKMGGE